MTMDVDLTNAAMPQFMGCVEMQVFDLLKQVIKKHDNRK